MAFHFDNDVPRGEFMVFLASASRRLSQGRSFHIVNVPPLLLYAGPMPYGSLPWQPSVKPRRVGFLCNQPVQRSCFDAPRA